MKLWLTIIGAGLVTYAIRLSFFALFRRARVPDTFQRALRFIPPAVLTAIILPEMLMPGGFYYISVGNSRLIAGLVAAAVAWRTRNVLLTIAAGMAVYWILEYVAPAAEGM